MKHIERIEDKIAFNRDKLDTHNKKWYQIQWRIQDFVWEGGQMA